MDGSIRLSSHERNVLLEEVRRGTDPQRRLRAHPERAKKLRKLLGFLRNLPADELAVFQDEVDINTNPKIGSMWMRKGQQAEVVTPGTNTKRYPAGSLNWRTGEVLLSEAGPKRNAQLFLAHLDELRRRFRRYRCIHVICDNASSTTPRAAERSSGIWPNGVIASSFTSYRPTPRTPTRSNGCGGICTKRSLAIIAVPMSKNC